MKKLISYLLIATLLVASVLAIIPINVGAEGVGSTCTAPTEGHATQCTATVLSSSSKYPSIAEGGTYIYTVNDIKLLFASTGAGALNAQGGGKTYVIQNDIILPAGFTGGDFKDATIDGMNTDGRVCTIHFENARYMFGWGLNLTFKNLNLDGYIIINDASYAQHVAPLAMHGIDGNANLENITSSVHITVKKWKDNDNPSSDQKVGGVISKFDSGGPDTLKNVVFNGSITIEATAPVYGAIGGIAGNGSSGDDPAKGGVSSLTAVECHNYGTITVNSKTNGKHIGGLFGFFGSDVDMVNCTNEGDIIVNGDATESCLGGILGSGYALGSKTISLVNCRNEGDIKSLQRWKTDAAGNIVVGTDKYTENNVEYTNTVNVRVENVKIGGIIGRIHDNEDYTTTVKLSKCTNNGSFENRYGRVCPIGGMIGNTYNCNVVVEYCINEENGDIITANEYYKSQNTGHVGIAGMIGEVNSPGKYQIVNGEIVMTQTDRTCDINYCVNYGSFSIRDGAEKSINLCAGGMIGRSSSAPYITITNCKNYGVIDLTLTNGYAWMSAGGMIGAYMTVAPAQFKNGTSGAVDFGWSKLPRGALVVTDCHNYTGANITSPAYAGGMLGGGLQLLSDDITVTFERCTNAATIKGAQYAGGIAGAVALHTATKWKNMGKLTFSYCTNEGAVTSTCQYDSFWAAGGILGVMDGDSTTLAYGDTGYTKASSGNNSAVERTWFYYCANLKNGVINVNTSSGSSYAGRIAGYVSNYTQIDGSMAAGTHFIAGAKPSTNDWIGTGYNAQTIANSNNEATAEDLKNQAQVNDGFIRSADDFYKAFQCTKNSAGEYKVGVTGAYYLEKDITLTVNYGNESSSATTDRATFLADGVFYGQGHTITLQGADYLFFKIADYNKQAAIYDLTLRGTIDVSSTHASPITKHGSSSTLILSNITSYVNVNYSGGGDAVSGIYAKGTGSSSAMQDIVEDCTYHGKIVYNAPFDYTYATIGGIYANPDRDTLMVNCKTSSTASITVSGAATTISEYRGVGGIVGMFTADLTMIDCENNAPITISNGTKVYAGGIVGSGSRNTGNTPTLSINNCNNKAKISGAEISGGIIGGFPYNMGDAGCTVLSSYNKGNVSATSIAGGILGNNNSTEKLEISGQCTNAGTVTATSYAGGIVGRSVSGLTATGVANVAAVTGGNYVGGIAGYLTGTTAIMSTVNRGAVSGTNYVGGIIGGAEGTVNLQSVANGGNVSASDTSSATVTAAGVIAYITNATAVNINNCASSGAVTLAKSAASENDTSVTAAGIVGISASAATVTNCINLGAIATGGENSSYSAYPISNPTNGNVTPTAAGGSGNLYKKGTVLLDASNYTLSSTGSNAAIKAAVIGAELWAFDTATFEAQREIAEQGLADGLYVGAQKTTLQTQIANAAAYLESDWTVAKNWVYQEEIIAADDALWSAINNYTSKASYIVYIPESVPTESDNTLLVKPVNFNIHSEFKVTFESDFVLTNTVTPEDTLTYTLAIGGVNKESGEVLTSLSGKNVSETEYVVRATVTQSTNVAGTYTGVISFIINYDDTVKKTYED